MKKNPTILVIIGPTASGKTKLAVELARAHKGEIISADSRQVYKGMDIGSGKDLAEYGTGKMAVKYHLIDVADPKEQYNLFQYQKAAQRAILDVLKRGKLPIIVGGSGLYLQAVVDGYILGSRTTEKTESTEGTEEKDLKDIQALVIKQDKAFFDRLNNSEKNNKRRLIRYLELLKASGKIHETKPRIKKPPYDFIVIGLEVGMETLRKRIKQRLIDRIDSPVKPGNDNLITEVERLHKEGLSWERLESFGLEYKFVAQYLQKKLSKEEMIGKLSIAIGQFAKRQMTWFRRWEKQGREIMWFETKDLNKIDRFLFKKS